MYFAYKLRIVSYMFNMLSSNTDIDCLYFNVLLKEKIFGYKNNTKTDQIIEELVSQVWKV